VLRFHKEQYSLRTFSTNVSKDKFLIQQEKKGSYATDYSVIKLAVMGLNGKAKSCLVDGEKVEFEAEDGKITLKVKANFKALEFQL